METIRDAGHNERRCIARDSLGLYGAIVTLGTYLAPADWDSKTTEDVVTASLQTCIAQHPTLTTIVRDGRSEKPSIAKAAEFNLGNHLRLLPRSRFHEDDLTASQQALLEQVHNEPLDHYDTRPQWRLYVQPLSSSKTSKNRFLIAFSSSHALVDGISGLIVHETFLAALRANTSSGHMLPRPAVKEEVCLALDQATKLPLTWIFFLKTIASEFLPPWVTKALGLAPPSSCEAWYGAETRPSLPDGNKLLPTAIHVAQIPPETLVKLLEACRAQRSRLTGLMNHLAARAIASSLRSRGHAFGKFVVDTAMDLRRCVPQAQGRLANYASAITEVHTIETSTLDLTQPPTREDWVTARNTTNHLLQASSTLTDHSVALLKYVSNAREWASNRARNPAPGSFSVSNLGTFDGQAPLSSAGESTWVVEEMLFSQSADGTGSALGINFASAKRGALCITLTWWPGMLGIEDEGAFVEEIGVAIVRQVEVIAWNR